MSYKPEEIRKDFPVLSRRINGKLPVYMDNACMTLKPAQVVDAMNRYYFEHPSCHKRAVHHFGKMTTEQFRKARCAVQAFIQAKQAEEIVFTRNTTESINIVAHGLRLQAGEAVLTSDLEHNSNLLPWIALSSKGIKHHMFALTPDSPFSQEEFEKALTPEVKLVSVFHTSHVTGQTLPVAEIIKTAHAHGALVLLDGAQSVGHQRIDVQNLDVDFLAFSFHKMLGPTGMGCLYAKKEHLRKMPPLLVGGETVEDVDYGAYLLSDTPAKFEAGLQNYAGAMGVSAALDYLKQIGMDNLQQHVTTLNETLTTELQQSDKVHILGPPAAALRAGIVNFTLNGMDSGELSLLLDQTDNIMTRSGIHCCHAWYKKYNKPPSLRVSLYAYNTIEEVRHLAETINNIIRYF